ncbi:MAG: HNH endonuclease [Actinomycetota bacterium]|nr:HNH endonuclease [Actinomycetota bacterium]
MKTLFALSCNVCAYPGCDERLTDPSWKEVRGDIAHIRGEKLGAARYDASMADEARHDFANLVLLCPNHHRLIDRLDPDAHSEDELVAMKVRHEERCAGSSNWADDVALTRFARLVIAALLTEDDDQPYRVSTRAELADVKTDWAELGDEPEAGTFEADDPIATKRWVIVVANTSDRPIFDCQVIARAPHGPLVVNALDFGTVEPGAREWHQQTWNMAVAGNVVSGVSCRVLFTDAEGRHWERGPDGSLATLSEAPATVAQRALAEYVERSQLPASEAARR